MSNQISYRPHNSGHDYYERGAYLVTLVVTGREPRLSSLNNDADNPSVILTATGHIVEEEWAKTAAIQERQGRQIEVVAQVCMPDHWHGVVVVKERMDKSLGAIIQYVKSAITARWRKEITGYVQPTCTSTMIRHIGQRKRRAYYATRPLIERPLFDDDYDDTICLNDEHRKRMIAYVIDNPRRAIYRQLLPQFMQRQLHIEINGTDYAAFGNLFLLRWARKIQIFCHRKARLSQLSDEERLLHGYTYAASGNLITHVPYEQTAAFANECKQLITNVLQGATVIVTPGISKGEQLIKNEAIKQGYPLIHLQKEPISRYWKPELSRFNACINGSLLILSPWHLDAIASNNSLPSSSDYSLFHNLNTLAEHICQFDGEARIVRE